MSPEQKVFTKIRALCVGLFGADKVYDFLPPESVAYPFVFIGEQFAQSVNRHKDGRSKATQVTIHVWHSDMRRRGELTKMIGQIENAIIGEYGLTGDSITTQVIIDRTTSAPLLHGIVEPDIKFKEW